MSTMTRFSRPRWICFWPLLLFELLLCDSLFSGLLWQTCDVGMRPFIFFFMVPLFGGLTLLLTVKGVLILVSMIAVAYFAASAWCKLIDRVGLVTMMVACVAVVVVSGFGFAAWLATHGAHPVSGNCVL